MKCKGCKQEIDEYIPIQKVTFSVSDRATEDVLGVFVGYDGVYNLDLSEPVIEIFEREVIYQCGYCNITYTREEVIDVMKKIAEEKNAMPGM